MNDTATKTAAAGVDYDSLSQVEQDQHDVIAAMAASRSDRARHCSEKEDLKTEKISD